MKKIVRLTESDLARIVRRVIKENDEPKPKSITINFTKKWEDNLKSMKSDNLQGHLNWFDKGVKLYPNQWFLIGLGPYERSRNNRTFFYASYSPENNEVYVHVVNCKGENIKSMAEEDQAHPEYFHRIFEKGIYKDGGYESGCVNAGGFYSKFEDSDGNHTFRVGELDHRGYFEIVDIVD